MLGCHLGFWALRPPRNNFFRGNLIYFQEYTSKKSSMPKKFSPGGCSQTFFTCWTITKFALIVLRHPLYCHFARFWLFPRIWNCSRTISRPQKRGCTKDSEFGSIQNDFIVIFQILPSMSLDILYECIFRCLRRQNRGDIHFYFISKCFRMPNQPSNLWPQKLVTDSWNFPLLILSVDN